MSSTKEAEAHHSGSDADAESSSAAPERPVAKKRKVEAKPAAAPAAPPAPAPERKAPAAPGNKTGGIKKPQGVKPAVKKTTKKRKAAKIYSSSDEDSDSASDYADEGDSGEDETEGSASEPESDGTVYADVPSTGADARKAKFARGLIDFLAQTSKEGDTIQWPKSQWVEFGDAVAEFASDDSLSAYAEKAGQKLALHRIATAKKK